MASMRAVLCHALDDDAIPRLRNACLTMERVYADRLSVEKSREDTAGNETDEQVLDHGGPRTV